MLTRQDAQIDFNWTLDKQGNHFVSPGAGVPGEYFSVRWTGWLYAPTTGFYLLQTTADDGMRVWVGGRAVINSWRDQSATAATSRVRLEAGRYYPLRVEYYQKDRDSRARLAWVPPGATTSPQPIPATYLYADLPPTARRLPPTAPPAGSKTGGRLAIVAAPRPARAVVVTPPPGTATPVKPEAGRTVAGAVESGTGLQATYYAGPVSAAGTLSRIEPEVNVVWRGGAPAPGVPGAGFSVRWTGYVRAPETGVYVLRTTWDDAHDLHLAGQSILEMTKYEPEFFGARQGEPIPVEAVQRYEAGRFYPVELAYKNVRGNVSRAVLSWTRPAELGQPTTLEQAFAAAKGRRFTVIPKQYLYPELPAAPPLVAAVPSRPTPKPAAPPPPKPTPKPAVAARRPAPKSTSKPVTQPTADSARPILAELGTLRKGAALTLPNLYFTQSTADLLPASRPVLNELAQTLRQQPALRLEIAGHTDNVGDAALNRRLSQQRAQVVRRYLVQQGVDSLRLTAVGYGGARPVADNRHPALRPRNRRVEVVVR